MDLSDRQEHILTLLREERYLSVERLSALTYTSPSSIRRDLTHLQQLRLIRRTHGGASVLNEVDQAAPLRNRMTKNVVGKRAIAKKASALLRDGMTVMLDGSTTAGFLVPYIAKHKRITLFTNNMLTALEAINFGIDTHCLGGSTVDRSAVLTGPIGYASAAKIHSDICFFSSHSLDVNGIISDPTEEENHIRTLMLENTEQRIFLCDHEKFDRRSLYTLTTLDKVDAAVLDEPWDELKSGCQVL